jgi:alpha-L-fucosidase
MKTTRRTALQTLAAASTAGLGLHGQDADIRIAPGPFTASRASLMDYRIPEWYANAKFGIWAHWGPQSAPEVGDWYARQMYIQGHRQYEYHVKTYGHPSKFGYKDIIPTWKAESFDPDYLLGLYKRAGAQFFVSMGVHHDNFDLWDSKYQPRWNAVAMGPKKNIVRLFRNAAAKQGLRFGVSQHLHASYEWMATCFGSDKTGPLAGVPYDGNDARYSDLYHEKHAIATDPGDVSKVPESWKRQYFLRLQDLIDQLEPDMMYHDGVIRFEKYGLSLVAHLYNQSARRNGGKVEAVYACKGVEDCQVGTCVLDFERGIAEGIWPQPFETDTCIGDWHYNRDAKYKTVKQLVDLLVNVVSRNGTLLLNFPLRSNGTLDDREMAILAELTAWMKINGEGIFGTRAWDVCGEGPSVDGTVRDTSVFKRVPGIPDSSPGATRSRGARDSGGKALTERDIRFTRKGGSLYAFVMGWPAGEIVIRSVNDGAAKVENVELLGFGGRLKWAREATGLRVQLPAEKPCDHACGLKIAMA